MSKHHWKKKYLYFLLLLNEVRGISLHTNQYVERNEAITKTQRKINTQKAVM